MSIRESEWLGRRLASLPSDQLFPLLNVGSSTEEYRTIMQPWIDQNIFAPIRSRGGKVYHLDMKQARGVDIVGGLLDSEFLDRVAQMRVKCVMVFISVRDQSAGGCRCSVEDRPAGGINSAGCHVAIVSPSQ
jgi:hypothetical protein